MGQQNGRLIEIDGRRHPRVEPVARDRQGIASYQHRAQRKRNPFFAGARVVIACRHVRDQTQAEGPLAFHRGEVVLQCSRAKVAHSAPEVELERAHADLRAELAEFDGARTACQRRIQARKWRLVAAGADAGINVRHLVGALDPIKGARLFDARRRSRQITVVDQGLADQHAQLHIAEELLPGHVLCARADRVVLGREPVWQRNDWGRLTRREVASAQQQRNR
ncbi:hypothetical protein D3C71_1387370 [compost metagenome]